MRRTLAGPWATILPMLACVLMASSARGASQPIEFMAPTGGEVYLIGQLAQVRLDPKTKYKQVIIELSRDGGATFDRLGTIDNTVKDKYFRNKLNFLVSGPPTTSGVIRALAMSGSVVTFPTSLPFCIGVPSGITEDKLSSGAAAAGAVLAANGSGGAAFTAPGSSALWSTTGNTGTSGDGQFLGTTDAADLTLRTNNTERLRVTAGGNVGLGVSAPANPLQLANGAFCSPGGVWTDASDRNVKENFAPVNGAEVLEKVARLPITQWNYKVEADSVRHVGPLAQDFHALFALGGSDRTISTIDPSGIALVAIQELKRRNDVLRAENELLKARLSRLEDRVRE